MSKIKVKSNKAGSYTLNVECVETKDKFEISLNVYNLYTVKFVVENSYFVNGVDSYFARSMNYYVF